MKHPDPTKLKDFTQTLSQISNLEALKQVNMFSVEEPSCGTPGCFAGLVRASLDSIGVQRVTKRYNFTVEAVRLSQFLFDSVEPRDALFNPVKTIVCRWAETHTGIWGNRWGLYMFSSGDAYGGPPVILQSTQIADHWQGVYERLLQHQHQHQGS